MEFTRTTKCPSCGMRLDILPEAGKIGVVCPNCKTFIGQRNDKMSEEEIKKVTAAIFEMLHNSDNSDDKS